MPTPAAGRPSPTAAEEHDNDWSGVRLHVVTGKGGTGKTTVAAALALALATDGGRVLLMEVEGRQGRARLFDVPQLPYDERRVAVAPGGGEVLGLAVEPKAALLEYLQMFYKLGRAGTILEKIGAVDFATTIAPGVRDVLLTGKVYEAFRRRHGKRPAFDAIVLDAPPTGRIGRFLNVNTELAGLARVGPIHSQADSIHAMLRSPQTVIHLVTLREEMPGQETADAIEELSATGLPIGGVVVNLAREPVLAARRLGAAGKGRLDADEVTEGLAAAGLEPSPAGGKGVLDGAGGHAPRPPLGQRARGAGGGPGGV